MATILTHLSIYIRESDMLTLKSFGDELNRRFPGLDYTHDISLNSIPGAHIVSGHHERAANAIAVIAKYNSLQPARIGIQHQLTPENIVPSGLRQCQDYYTNLLTVLKTWYAKHRPKTHTERYKTPTITGWRAGSRTSNNQLLVQWGLGAFGEREGVGITWFLRGEDALAVWELLEIEAGYLKGLDRCFFAVTNSLLEPKVLGLDIFSDVFLARRTKEKNPANYSLDWLYGPVARKIASALLKDEAALPDLETIGKEFSLHLARELEVQTRDIVPMGYSQGAGDLL